MNYYESELVEYLRCLVIEVGGLYYSVLFVNYYLFLCLINIFYTTLYALLWQCPDMFGSTVEYMLGTLEIFVALINVENKLCFLFISIPQQQ